VHTAVPVLIYLVTIFQQSGTKVVLAVITELGHGPSSKGL
jgi:hypothetical protein